jgi:hypothetical protein
MAIKQRHADLGHQLELEQKRLMLDWGMLADLKRPKIALKNQSQDA